MGRIKKWLEWIGAALVAILGVVTLGALRAKQAEAQGEEIGHAEADRQSVQKDRARTAGESTEDLFKDLTESK